MLFEPLAKVYLNRIANAYTVGSADDMLRAYPKVCTRISSAEDAVYPSQPIGHQSLLAHARFWSVDTMRMASHTTLQNRPCIQNRMMCGQRYFCKRLS